MSILLILSWLVPLAAAALAPSPRFWWLPAIAAVPALAAVVLVPLGAQVEIPWLLLGSVLGLDSTAKIFLGFTAVLWLSAGLYAAGSMRAGPHAGRFRAFFLLAMSGNFWLIVGQDLASFYAGFSLMGLASYGLVAHNGDRFALHAGKVYMVMTMLGELALFVALVLIANETDTLVPNSADLVGLSDLTVGLLLAGLAIKAGLVPVHVWLPLAHPAAPVPASAVLSGAMIKVALLGWLRFLPIGEVPMTAWGLLLIVAGLLTLFYALPVGLVQSNAKVILAYSSVSKMGLMTLTLGLILLEPDLAVAGVLALSLYAAHHALAKGGLFLGVGMRHQASSQVLVLAGIVLLALSLAAVPLSGGAVAKYGIKPLLAETNWSWLVTAVAVSTVGTALLTARFVSAIWQLEPHPSPGLGLGGAGWAALLVLILLYSALLGRPDAWETNWMPTLFSLTILFPFGLATRYRPDLLRPSADMVPAGDLLGLARFPIAVLGFSGRTLGRRWNRLLRSGSARLRAAGESLGSPPKDPERILRRWPNAGAAWLAVTALVLLLPLSATVLFRTTETLGNAAVPEESLPTHGASQAPVTKTDSMPSPSPGSGTRVKEDPPESSRNIEPVSPTTTDASPPALSVEQGSSAQASPEEDAAGEQTLDIKRPGTVEPKSISVPDFAHEGPATDPAASLQDPSSERPSPWAGAVHDDQSRPPIEQSVFPAEPRGAIEVATDRLAEAQPRASSADEQLVARCDPDIPFVLSHPHANEAISLTECVPGPNGTERAIAPALTNTLVGLVQRHLSDLGYDPGPADGFIGPRTRDAIRRFQKDQGDISSGTITFAFLKQLSASAAERKPVDSPGALPD